jgi:hypothetical protein
LRDGDINLLAWRTREESDWVRVGRSRDVCRLVGEVHLERTYFAALVWLLLIKWLPEFLP